MKRSQPYPQMVRSDGRGVLQPALLVHGLLGRGSEWRTTIRWLRDRFRIVAPDLRGHGANRARRAADFATLADDLAGRLERLAEPALVVGQSMGGVVALLLAARRPELVDRLVLIEATARSQPRRSERPFVDDWPLPFPEARDVTKFFGGTKEYAQTWLDNFERTPDGYRPILSRPDLLTYLAALERYDHTAQWRRIACPTLVVGGGRSGVVSHDELRGMAANARNGRYIEATHGSHDLHLDAPHEWRAALETFLPG